MSGASLTIPKQASAFRQGGHILLKGHPCKVVAMSTSKTGKHGHAKVNFTGIDIFTGKKYEEICQSTHNMEEPIVKRSEWQLLDIDEDDFLMLMDKDGNEKGEAVKLTDDEDGQKIREFFETGEDGIVTVCAAMGTEKAISIKRNAEEI